MEKNRDISRIRHETVGLDRNLKVSRQNPQGWKVCLLSHMSELDFRLMCMTILIFGEGHLTKDALAILMTQICVNQNLVSK